MQIQRIQTVYIFLAMVAMMIFLIVPYGEVHYIANEPVGVEKLYVMYEYGLLIPVDFMLYRGSMFRSVQAGKG